jgi:hypothetical protein
MKVGVLTCHSCHNYGANLQLFATVRSLEKMGHEVFVYDNRDYAESACRAFVVHHFKLTQPCRKDDEFRSETLRLKIDAIVVGSDAVLWFLPAKAEGLGAYPNPFWLRWAKDLPVRKVLLAGSCMGLMFPKIRGSLRAQIKQDLGEFDYISVRDRWTQLFVQWAGIRGSTLVFDPTSSLPNVFKPDASTLPEGLELGKYIVFTFSGVEKAAGWMRRMSTDAHAYGLKTCFIPHPDRLCRTEEVDYLLPEVMDPLDWLTVLSCSAGYVGERFHPVVLSAFYGIPFISSDYYSRSGPAALFNGRSKTRDFCKRIGALSDVIPADSFFSKRSPEAVLHRLSAGYPVNVSACRSVFENALNEALEV